MFFNEIENVCLCVHARVVRVRVCLCVCAVRGCVTEKETASKRCSLLSPEVFIFLSFKEQKLQPLLPVRGKAEVSVSSYLGRNQHNFLGFFSSFQARIQAGAVQYPLSFEGRVHPCTT